MSQQRNTDHTTRNDYDSLTSALADALRVQNDLLKVIDQPDTLFLDVDQVHFLARRAHKLIAAAHQHAQANR